MGGATQTVRCVLREYCVRTARVLRACCAPDATCCVMLRDMVSPQYMGNLQAQVDPTSAYMHNE